MRRLSFCWDFWKELEVAERLPSRYARALRGGLMLRTGRFFLAIAVALVGLPSLALAQRPS
ncbi:MAG: hypothetical protein WBW58_10420, partial [Candidatus Acidiferrum sp.]